jgi:hypothetical protein
MPLQTLLWCLQAAWLGPLMQLQAHVRFWAEELYKGHVQLTVLVQPHDCDMQSVVSGPAPTDF